MRKRTKDEFIQILRGVNPKLSLVKLHKSSKDFTVVKDELDILYNCTAGNLLAGKMPTIESAIDKVLFLNKKLQSLFSNLTVSKYESGKKVYVTDDLGITYFISITPLLLGSYPSIQTAIDKEKAIIKKANKIHNNHYSYPNLKYLGMRTKVSISCPEHGEFWQTPDNHLRGQGCKKCANSLINSIGWSKDNWIKLFDINKDRIAKLYIIELWGNEESFLKVGITSTSLKQRFESRLPYKYKILDVIEGNPSTVFETEKKLKFKFKKYRYVPKMEFCGMYECYKFENETMDIDKIKEMI